MAADEKDAKAGTAPQAGMQNTTTAGQPVTVNLIQPDRAAEGARAIEEGRALQMDTTVPGGRYRVGDQIVDANGEPIKDDKDAKDEE
jgi:hypothetical protein